MKYWDRSRGPSASFLQLTKDNYAGGEMKLPLASDGCKELLTATWVTPESLLRKREAGGRSELAAFMKEFRLGVMVCAPTNDGRTPFILALRVRRDRSPYTWSDIKLLQDCTALIENTLSRISLTQQARESEQLPGRLAYWGRAWPTRYATRW